MDMSKSIDGIVRQKLGVKGLTYPEEIYILTPSLFSCPRPLVLYLLFGISRSPALDISFPNSRSRACIFLGRL